MKKSNMSNPGSKLLVTIFVLLLGDVYLFATKSYIGGAILSVITVCDLLLLFVFVKIQNKEFDQMQKQVEKEEIICKGCGYVLRKTDLECPNCHKKTEEENEDS